VGVFGNFMHELTAADSKGTVFVCNAYMCGRLFSLYDAIGHAVANQFKVNDDNSGLVLGSNEDSYKQPRQLQKVRTRHLRR
jgi:hypothetical protein